MIVRGGVVVTPEGLMQADLAVEDGRISAIAPELPGAAVEIDARGLGGPGGTVGRTPSSARDPLVALLPGHRDPVRRPSGTDDRFSSSVGMGLRPAKLHEKLRQAQGIPRCSRWFFDPVGGRPSAETPGTGPHTGSLGAANTSVCATKQIAALTAGNPARRFGIANKGKLAVGFDADFTLVDLGAQYAVTRESLFQRHGLSPYLGATFRGVVRRTVLRGETIFADGKIVGEARGRMVTHATTGTHT